MGPETALSRKRLLIEEWLPIAEIGIESLRERTPMTPVPAPNRLHVWWAPTSAGGEPAAVLASLLPADANRENFLHTLGIHGDPLKAKKRIAEAGRQGERLGANAYGYKRAFSYSPETADVPHVTVLDPTAGGGAIPFEALRLGQRVIANDLNPVAWLVLKATLDLPYRFGPAVLKRYEQLAKGFDERCKERIRDLYPEEPEGFTCDGYLRARTVKCMYCGCVVPLSPNWALTGKGAGVRLLPVEEDGNRFCRFEMVKRLEDQSEGTVAGGDAKCPFPGCNSTIDGDEIKRQAQAGNMGQQLYAVVYKYDQVVSWTKTGKPKLKRQRGFRAPRPEDDVEKLVARRLAEEMQDWEARGIVSDEQVPEGYKTEEARRFGICKWRDIFSPR